MGSFNSRSRATRSPRGALSTAPARRSKSGTFPPGRCPVRTTDPARMCRRFSPKSGKFWVQPPREPEAGWRPTAVGSAKLPVRQGLSGAGPTRGTAASCSRFFGLYFEKARSKTYIPSEAGPLKVEVRGSASSFGPAARNAKARQLLVLGPASPPRKRPESCLRFFGRSVL